MDIIFNQIREGFKNIGLPYISPIESFLFLLAILMVLFFVLWIALRRIKLWYWKTDIQIDTLKNIDNHLVHIEEKLSGNIKDSAEAANSEKQLQSEKIDSLNQEIVQETSMPEGKFAIGRSGKVYTEAELELQIRE
ncbi:MAG: hypothetical protein ACOX4V_07410 [Anaerovoracaceae bacterium]|jgi:hypothetical protein